MSGQAFILRKNEEVKLVEKPKGAKRPTLFNERNEMSARGDSFPTKRESVPSGQATKSKGRMPWRQEPKKDAESCEKPREGAYSQRTAGIRMGEPGRANLGHRIVNR